MRYLTLLALCLVACGDAQEPPPTATAPQAADTTAVASLIPGDATVIFRAASLDRQAAVFAAIGELTRGAGSPLSKVDAMLGFDPGQYDRTRPVYVVLGAFASPASPAPITLIAPTADPDAAAAKHNAGGTATADGYVAVSQDPDYAGGGGSALLNGFPNADLAVRCDVAALLEVFGGQVEGAMMQAGAFMAGAMQAGGNPDAAAPLNALLTRTKSLVDSTVMLDLSLGVRDGEFDLRLDVHTNGRGPVADLAGKDLGVTTLGAHLPSGLPMNALLRVDMAALNAWSGAGAMAESEGLSESARAYLKRAQAMNERFGGTWAIAFEIGPGGMRGAFANRTEDAAAVLAEYVALLKDPGAAEVGFACEFGEARKVGEVAVTTLRARIDMEKAQVMFGEQAAEISAGMTQKVVDATTGKDGLLMEMAARGDELYFGIGGADMMDRLLGEPVEPDWLKRERAEVAGEIAFLMHMDLVSFMRGMADVLKTVEPGMAGTIPTGAAPPMTITGAIDGSTLRLRVHGNPGAIKAAMEPR